ncbi:MAG: hypothetical protein MRJ66_10570 [Nitrospira sp.]|nr:hypothetical protein [Nitrospira sp.]
MSIVRTLQNSIKVSIALAALTGCAWPLGDVPPALRIDTGVDPDKQDQYTRFRTTYYFRVLDSCRVNDGTDGEGYDKALGAFKVRKSGKTRILNDTVYRFRMTGKSSALFNKVSFGSGVLRADQIDPFGSRVEYRDGEFKIKTGHVIRQKELRDALMDEINDLRSLHDRLARDQSKDLGAEELRTIIRGKVKLLNGGGTSPSTSGPSTHANTKPTNALCPDGRPIRKSYFLYGPEGVRELDPDERLLMAMSSDSKPLISLLQELSARQRNALTRPSVDATVLIDERTWLEESEQRLKDIDNGLEAQPDAPPSPQDLVDELVSTKRGVGSLSGEFQ